MWIAIAIDFDHHRSRGAGALFIVCVHKELAGCMLLRCGAMSLLTACSLFPSIPLLLPQIGEAIIQMLSPALNMDGAFVKETYEIALVALVLMFSLAIQVGSSWGWL